jgi:EAL domain-containing protein (putative c-di-GMP-specific phosphodiesterase class I)
MHARQIPIASTGGKREGSCPRVCIISARPHVQAFLGECFEELGLTMCPADRLLGAMPGDDASDLVAVDLSGGDPEPESVLGRLANGHYRGKVMILGPPGEPKVPAAREYGRRLGLAMLPTLYTPCRGEELRERVSAMMPADPVQPPWVDVGRALREGWLELWYQPKIEICSLRLAGAEALVRMRHPEWGILTPDRFLPEDGDPRLRVLSDFVVARAAADWRYVTGARSSLSVAINLPLSWLLRPAAIRGLRQHLPAPPEGCAPIVEINSTDIVRDPAAAAEIVERLRQENIDVAADDVGAEWPQLLERSDLSFAEIKVDRKYVAGVADDEEKRSTCGMIVDLARARGARTVAEGVETTADFVAVRDLGFDMVQGFLFARAMHPHKFVRTFLRGCVVTQ